MNSDYINKIFGKEREQITLDDIKKYFLYPQEESSVVEFKSGEVEINDIYKEITAFLNTEGGLLIIGAPRETKKTIGKNIVKICQGLLTYSRFSGKDWLYQKIASNIVPTPTNLKISEFLTEKGNIFLIDIPQSVNPPHQCSSDGRYYLRLERDAKPAPHGIVQALFNKRKVPILKPVVKIEPINSTEDTIIIDVKNISTIPAEKVSFIVDIYNIDKIDSKWKFDFIKDSLGDKYSLCINLDQVLVQIISRPVKFSIKHLNKNYLISVAFWSRDLDFDFVYFLYSPEQKSITKEGTLKKGNLFLDELKNL